MIARVRKPAVQHLAIFEIFEWFHEFLEAASGSGLGPASCEGMLQRVGGRFWFESRTSEGSTFYFPVPSSSEAADC